jgi:hypothetical protein
MIEKAQIVNQMVAEQVEVKNLYSEIEKAVLDPKVTRVMDKRCFYSWQDFSKQVCFF